LEQWTGKKVSYFAYPNGEYSYREFQMLKALDYRLAFSTEAKYLTPGQMDNKYKLPRLLYLEGASFAENRCRMLGVWQIKTKSFILSKLFNRQQKGRRASSYKLDINLNKRQASIFILGLICDHFML
jgi:peptidoglycan/xylan/chitin deacetylase (PgdA/CDA1 family)